MSVSAAKAVPVPGALFAGKYRIDRLIGRGGMGSVFAATHIELDQKVAIKILLPELADDEQLVARFIREAKAAAKISGDHVARVLDVSRLEDKTPYIVLELLDGIDLSEQLARHGALPIELAVDCVIHACHALAQAHAAGVVHRDVKPSNLFLTTSDSKTPKIKVLDFGISKLASSEPDSPSVTRTQEVFGSPLYMSPEQIRSSRDVDGRGDLWSLGIVLFELLTGRTPFEAESTMAIAGAILHQPPHLLRALRPEAPPEIEHIVTCCLDKDRNQRPQTAADLADMLRPFASAAGRIVADGIIRVGPKLPPPPQLSGPPPAVAAIKELESARTLLASDGARDAPTVVKSRASKLPIGKIVIAILALGLIVAAVVLGPHRNRTPLTPAQPEAPTATSVVNTAAAADPQPTSEPSFAVEPQPSSSIVRTTPHRVRPRAPGTSRPSATPTTTQALPATTAPPAPTRMPRTGE